MAQRTEVTYTCDAKGCRKQLGETHDHVRVSLAHEVASKDTGGEAITPLGYVGAYDFCSLEHAARFIAELDTEERDRVVADLEAVREQRASEEAASSE